MRYTESGIKKKSVSISTVATEEPTKPVKGPSTLGRLAVLRVHNLTHAHAVFNLFVGKLNSMLLKI